MAVSGLARAFAYYKPSARYIAGLWDEDLVYGLQWSVVDSRALYPYPREGLGQYFGSTSYQAPSWSWAAHRFQVRYPGAYPSPTDAYRANIRDCTVEHISADIFGGISNAELTIDARMITDSLVGLSGRPRPWKLKELERSTRGHVQVALDFMDKDDWMQPMVRYIFQTRFPGFSETMSRVPPTIHCMLLHLRLSSSVPYGSIMGNERQVCSWAFMLLLRHSAHPGKFQRFGCAWTDNEETAEDLWRLFEDIPAETIIII